MRVFAVPVGAAVGAAPYRVFDGQSITLRTDKGDRTFPIVGVDVDYGSEQGTVHMRESIYRSLYNDTMISTVAAYLKAWGRRPTIAEWERLLSAVLVACRRASVL